MIMEDMLNKIRNKEDFLVFIKKLAIEKKMEILNGKIKIFLHI